MTLNGNKFISQTHIFEPGKGCYFETVDTAKAHGCSPNGVGFWTETYYFEGKTWYKCGNYNVFD